MHIRGFKLLVFCLSQNPVGLIETIKTDEGDRKIYIRARIFGNQIDRGVAFADCFFERSNERVLIAQEIERLAIPRILAFPHFEFIDLRIPFAGNTTIIVRRTHEPLTIAHAIAQIVSLLVFCARSFELSVTVVAEGQPRVRHCKVWIELNRLFIVSNRARIIRLRMLFDA